MKITKAEFERYEEVREGVLMNIFPIPTVEALSGLSGDVIIEIMTRYSELNKKYPDVGRG